MMVCDACKARTKDWNGDDPVCSFPRNGVFDSRGWNCATANAIRDYIGSPYLTDAGRPSNVSFCGSDDQYWASINISEIDMPSGAWRTLWVSWYKNRGRTESMWLLNETDQPQKPGADDIVAICSSVKTTN